MRFFSPASFLLTIAHWLLTTFLWSTCKQQVTHFLLPMEKITVSSLCAHPTSYLIFFFLFKWNWSDGAVARRKEQAMHCNRIQNTVWWIALNKEDPYPNNCFWASCVSNTCSVISFLRSSFTEVWCLFLFPEKVMVLLVMLQNSSHSFLIVRCQTFSNILNPKGKSQVKLDNLGGDMQIMSPVKDRKERRSSDHE